MNIFDVLVPSDEAFAIVLYENNRNKWESQAKRVVKLAEVEANELNTVSVKPDQKNNS